MIVNPKLSAHEYQEVITWKKNQIYFDTINNKKHGFNLYPLFKFGTGVCTQCFMGGPIQHF